jgi:hypothetical protein
MLRRNTPRTLREAVGLVTGTRRPAPEENR